jgi:ribose transport system permease protein
MDVINKKELLSSGRLSVKERVLKNFRFVISHSVFGPLLALFLTTIIFTIGTNGFFLSLGNILTILNLSGVLAIIALGVSMPILMGGIDLSVEGTMSLTSVVMGFLVKNSQTNIDIGFWVIPVVMIIGSIVGIINGLLNTKLKIPSFMATLGMGFVAQGLAVILSRGATIPFLDPRFQDLANGKRLLGIPNITIISVILGVILLVMQRRTPLGKSIYAIGGNEELAKQSGINAERVKISIFGLAGCLYGIAAFFLGSRLNCANPTLSKGFLFPAITAAIVGGTALTGGIGGALNAFIGTLVVTGLNNGMVLMQINPYIQGAVMGFILIGAVAVTIDREKIGIIK